MGSKKDNSDLIFELTASEGSEFKSFKVNRWGFKKTLITYRGQADKRRGKKIRLYVKVVGLKDDIFPGRDWGLFKEEEL